MKKRLIGLCLTFFLVVALSTVVFAEDYTATYRLDTDTFEENNSDDGDGSDAKKVLYINEDGKYLITGTASSDNEAITIEVSTGVTASITLQDVMLGSSGTSSSHYSVYRNLININDEANVTLLLEGNNTLYLYSYAESKAAIRVAPNASLTIEDGTDNGTGTLSVTSANAGAAIGGNGAYTIYDTSSGSVVTTTVDGESNGNITVNSGTITATKNALEEEQEAIENGSTSGGVIDSSFWENTNGGDTLYYTDGTSEDAVGNE